MTGKYEPCRLEGCRLISMTLENYKDLQSRFFQESTNFLYGAGITGQRFLSRLSDLGFHMDGFVDDDPNKQGTELQGIKVHSFQELEKLSNERTNIVLSSIYGNVLLRRLRKLPTRVFEAFSLGTDQYKAVWRPSMEMGMGFSEWRTRLEDAAACMEDASSREILRSYENVANGKGDSYQGIAPLASEEGHYFVEPVTKALPDAATIVDCGAYTGDMLWQMENQGIPFGKVYAIEASPSVYETLRANIVKLDLEDRVVPLNVALWDSDTELPFLDNQEMDTAGRIDVHMGGIAIPARCIDNLIRDRIDLLKMDIEGAELPALRGAEKTILRDRPILAISIYHSLHDIVEIPLYLHRLLDRYEFFVRHHSMVYLETVLYGIPMERRA